jgi:hypothetical protein
VSTPLTKSFTEPFLDVMSSIFLRFRGILGEVLVFLASFGGVVDEEVMEEEPSVSTASSSPSVFVVPTIEEEEFEC